MKNKRTQAQRQRIDFNRHAATVPVHEISDTEANEPNTLKVSALILACYDAGRNG